MQQSDHDRIMSPPSYRFTVWDPVEQSTSSLENVKDGSASEIDIPDFNDPYEDKIQALGARGEVYRRVADALTDKAMFHNGEYLKLVILIWTNVLRGHKINIYIWTCFHFKDTKFF